MAWAMYKGKHAYPYILRLMSRAYAACFSSLAGVLLG